MTDQHLYATLQTLSLTELNEVSRFIETQADKITREGRKNLLEDFKKMAAEKGLTLDEIIGNGTDKRKGRKLPAKYHNPNNPEQTWSGQGQMPKWMRALIAEGQGQEKSDFLI